jgi:hypothetical protein
VKQGTFENRFIESDAAAAENAAEHRAYLVGALARVNAPPAMQMFVAAVYRHTTTDAGRWWRVTHRELCGLDICSGNQIDPLTEVIRCSESTAKRVTLRARELGLVRERVADGKPYPDGGPRERQPGEKLEYQIDWDGVRVILGLKVARGQIDTHTCQIDTCKGQIDTCTCQSDTFENDIHRNKPVPVPDPYRVLEKNLTRYGSGTGAREEAPLLMDTITEGLLGDVPELLGLFASVCALNPIPGWTDCDADRLAWVGAAVYALRMGSRSKVGLFRWLVRGNHRRKISAADEDLAAKLIRETEAVACLL